MEFSPFREGDTYSTFSHHLLRAIEEINSLDNEYVLKASDTELETHYIEKVTFEPIRIDESDFYIEERRSTKIDVSHDFNRGGFGREHIEVPGTELLIAIPFEGDSGLLRLRPSTFSLSGYPPIDIKDNVIVFSKRFPDDSANSERLKTKIENQVKSLASAAQNLTRDVERHNNEVPQKIRNALQQKRARAHDALAAISELGIPIKRRDEAPTFTVPTKRRRAATNLPSVPKEKYEPEPVLAEAEYNHILGVLRSMSLVIERSPKSFASLDEEAIRTHFLIQLNGHYEGSATGETFNASGKTDILIRAGDRNVFIAECKFWRGPKGFSDAVDQLLGYLTWRDSKCALLIFNKTKDSSAIRDKIHSVMEGRPEHRKTITHDPEGDSRYVFVKESDPGREVVVTVQLFDFPVTGSNDDG